MRQLDQGIARQEREKNLGSLFRKKFETDLRLRLRLPDERLPNVEVLPETVWAGNRFQNGMRPYEPIETDLLEISIFVPCNDPVTLSRETLRLVLSLDCEFGNC